MPRTSKKQKKQEQELPTPRTTNVFVPSSTTIALPGDGGWYLSFEAAGIRGIDYDAIDDESRTSVMVSSLSSVTVADGVVFVETGSHEICIVSLFDPIAASWLLRHPRTRLALCFDW